MAQDSGVGWGAGTRPAQRLLCVARENDLLTGIKGVKEDGPLNPAIVSSLLECPLAPPTRAPVHTVGLWDGPGEDPSLGAGVIRSKGALSRRAGAASRGRGILRLSKQGVTHGSFFLRRAGRRWLIGGGLMRGEPSPGAHLEFFTTSGLSVLRQTISFLQTSVSPLQSTS